MIFPPQVKQKSTSFFLIQSRTKNWFLIVFILLFLNSIYSQQGKVDPNFNTYDDGLLGDGFDNAVRVVSLQPDGKLIVGGDYLNFNGAETPYLCRLYSDGTKDVSFDLGTGFNAKVYSSSIQPDGKIVLGGSFTAFNGSAAGRLIRLNADGSRDATFNTTIASNTGIIYATALQSDGNIIIVGSFTKYNGITANRLARILPDGNLDSTFNIGTGASGLVEEVQIQSDGKILVAGSFDSFNGFPNSSKIIRLNSNGSVDATFAIGSGFNDTVTALTLQPDGKILVGGVFTTYNGLLANRIVRLNPDGSIDASFISGLGFNNGGVAVIQVNASGSIMVGGSFTDTYNGSDVNRLVLLNGTGVINPMFDIGAGPFSATVYSLVTDLDGSWYVGGSFSIFDSQNQGRLAKIDALGTLDVGYLTAGVGFDNSVVKILSLPNDSAMIFGNFTKFNGVSVSRIARVLDNGTLDETFNTAGFGADALIKTSLIQPDDKIIFAGSFTHYNGIAANRITRILADGTLDTTFNSGTGFNNQIYTLALQLDGKTIVGGNFTNYNGVLINRIARLLPDGTIDSSFNVGLGADAIVETVLIQTDGKILVGGRFTFFNGSLCNRLIRLNTNGSIDYSFSVGLGFDKYVYTLALQSDNKLIVGGTFLNYNGAAVKRIVRLNTDGTFDGTFTTGAGFSNGEIRTILVQPDNRLLIGGTFSGTYNGVAVKRMLRLLSNGIYDTTFSVNLNGTLFSSCFTPENKVLIGGNFNSVSGITKHRVARIKLCTNSSVWNGTVWSNGLPSGEKELLFHEDYTLLASANGCNCSIDLGKKVVVPSAMTLGLSFNYIGSGTLILEDTAAFYQSDDEMINTGVVEVKRKTTPILKTDYTYWSSPVSSQQLIAVSPDSPPDKFYSFGANVANWIQETVTNTMDSGKGYIIRGPESFSETVPAIYESVFKGVPNNGIVSTSIGTTGTSNLIGNPYPSAINADLFLAANSSVIKGTVYLWTHNTAFANNVYTSNDYAVYNLLGGVGTSSAVNSGINNAKPNGKIASGQAFFVKGINGGGNAVFNNSMRIVGQNASFFKSNGIQNTKSLAAIEKHRIWLNLSNNQGAFKQILIGYATGASSNEDDLLDAKSFNGNVFLDFYSLNQETKLVIQARALPFEETDEVLLGYKAAIEGIFSINIDEVDGVLKNQSVFIEDKQMNIIHDLKKEAYSFFTEKGLFNDRFVLRYKDRNLGISAVDQKENTVLIFHNDKQIQISSLEEMIDKVIVYNLSGKQVYQKIDVNCKELIVFDIDSSRQMSLVKTTLQNGKTVTGKIMD